MFYDSIYNFHLFNIFCLCRDGPSSGGDSGAETSTTTTTTTAYPESSTADRQIAPSDKVRDHKRDLSFNCMFS